MTDLHARLARRDHIRRVFTASYEVTDSTRDIIRRTEVYLACAKALRLPTWNNDFAQEVIDVATAVGAVAVVHGNRALFSRTRRRGVERKPPRRLTRQETFRLARQWEDRLAREGMPGEGEKGHKRWLRGRDIDPTYATINAGVFEAATSYYWELERDLRVWNLWALEGLDLTDISKRTGIGRTTCHHIVARLRRAMAERAGLDQETGHASEDAEAAPGGDGLDD